jgi:hypothetical protein
MDVLRGRGTGRTDAQQAPVFQPRIEAIRLLRGSAYPRCAQGRQGRAAPRDGFGLAGNTPFFSEQPLVELTLLVNTINAWNRQAIAFRKLPD